jgi:hypothetical protein
MIKYAWAHLDTQFAPMNNDKICLGTLRSMFQGLLGVSPRAGYPSSWALSPTNLTTSSNGGSKVDFLEYVQLVGWKLGSSMTTFKICKTPIDGLPTFSKAFNFCFK